MPQTALTTITGTGQVSVTSSTTSIVPRNTSRAGVNICNTGSNTVFLGNAAVTAITGHALLAGTSMTLPITGEVYGITASASVIVTFLEVS